MILIPGLNIKIKRIENGLTQKQLRELVKISSNKIANIERGNFKNVDYDLMLKLAEVLNTTPQELFFKENQSNERS